MLTVSANFQNVLDAGRETPRDFFDVLEIYDSSYTPGAQIDPVEAERRWAVQNTLLNGNDVTRLLVSRDTARKYLGKQFNTLTLTLSNVDRTLAAYLQAEEIEGRFCVLRIVSQAHSASLEDSLVWFVGRIEKPGEVDNARATLTVKQLIGSSDVEVPARVFQTDDPEGRNPGDPFYEGFTFTPVSGSFSVNEKVRRRGILGALGLKKTETRMVSYSSLSGAPLNGAIPVFFGRCNVEGICFVYQDLGVSTNGGWVFSEGCDYGTESYESITNRTRGFTEPRSVTFHYGLRGTANGPTHTIAPGAYQSGLAYAALYVNGTTFNTDDPAPQITAIGRWLKVDLPDGSGGFTTTGWTDNPAYITRFVLTSAYWGKIPTAFLDDTACLATAAWCDAPVSDITNASQVWLPDTVQSRTGPGKEIRRYRASGVLDAHTARYAVGVDTDTHPAEKDAAYNFYEVGVDGPNLLTVNQSYVRRYTFNGGLTERTKLVDWLYESLLPTFRGYLTTNPKGQIQIKTLKPADSARLSASTSVGATSLPVEDVTVWRSNLTQKLLIGAHLATSEVRTPSEATFAATVQNAVTLTASKTGTITIAASGSTLSGGNSTTQATGTVTLSGTVDANSSATITLNGVAVSYQAQVEFDPDTGDPIILDTPDTMAFMLAVALNAHYALRRSFTASADGAVVTIHAKQGRLTVPALAYAHQGPVASPSTAPTLAAAGSGTFAAGVYRVGYCWNRGGFRTRLSNLATITLAANQRIVVTGVTPPAGCTVDWFLSELVNDVQVRWILNNAGTGHTIANLPLAGADFAPVENTTAEEILRVAMAFADGASEEQLEAAELPYANMLAGFKYPLGSRNSPINQVAVRFRDARQDFAENTLIVNDKAHQRKIGKINKAEISLLGVDNLNQAERLANQILAGYREGSDSASWTAGPPAVVLEEGDVVTVSDAGNGLRNLPVRIEELGLNPNHTVDLVGRRYSTEQFLDFAPRHTIPLPSILNDYPPPIDSLTLTATLTLTANGTDAIARIDGLATFTHFQFQQQGRVFWKRPGASDYEFTGQVLLPQGEDLEAAFFVNNAAVGTHYFKIVTEALGGAAQTVATATAYSVVVNAPTAAVLQIADINFWREADAPRGDGVYLGVCAADGAADYLGAVVQADLGDGQGYREVARCSAAQQAVLGQTVSALGVPADVNLIDEVNTLVMTLRPGATLATVTLDQARAGANKIRVGSEILCFVEAEQTNAGTNEWTARRLLRAWHGTETKVAHGAGSDVLLLNEAVMYLSLPSALLNQTRNFRAVSIGTDESEADVIAFLFLFVSSLPFAPGQVAAYRFEENWLIEWQGRQQYVVPVNRRFVLRVREFGDMPLVRTVQASGQEAQPFSWINLLPLFYAPPLPDELQAMSAERMSEYNSWIECPVTDQGGEQIVGLWDAGLNLPLYELQFINDDPPTPGVFVVVTGRRVTYYDPDNSFRQRLRVAVENGFVTMYVNYINQASSPIYTFPLSIGPNPNLRAYVRADVSGIVYQTEARGQTGKLRYRYTKEEQEEDFGDPQEALHITLNEINYAGREGYTADRSFAGAGGNLLTEAGDSLLTEAGDSLLTEAGDNLVLEQN